MKKSQNKQGRRSARNRSRFFRIGIFAAVLLVVGTVTAIAKYESHDKGSSPNAAEKSAAPTNGFVTVDVGGKKIQVNALAMQQGPLTQEQSQQIADALQNNKSTAGLVQVQHADGTVEMDLQGRFQNVMLAKKNDDGSISEACVDTPEAANAFLQSKDTSTAPETPRKAAIKE